MTHARVEAMVGRLRAAGIELQLDGSRLRVHGARRLLTRELQEELRALKADLVAYLGGRLPAPDAPLSSAQRRLWFLDQMQPGMTGYTLGMAERLDGPLDVPALERAVTALVGRHEILRTTFPLTGGLPVQRVGTSDGVALRVSAFREGAVEDEFATPFDLARGPLFRPTILRLAPDAHILVLTAHHIVADGWSVAILGRELAALYAAERDRVPAALADVTLQYRDYAVSQAAWLRSDRLRVELEAWKRALAGLPHVLALPADRPRPAVPSMRGGRVEFRVDPETTAALRGAARNEGATLFMSLFTCMATVLGRWCRQPALVMGTPIAGRHREEVGSLVGCLVNTLPIGLDLGGDPSFAGLVRRVRETTLAAYDHQDLPFERLVEELQPDRDLTRNPLAQVSFGLHNAPGQSPLACIPIPGVTATPLDIEAGTVRFDLECDMWEVEGGLHGRLLYATDLFDRSTIERLACWFTTFAGQAARTPGERISRLPILRDDERREMAARWNPPIAAAPRALLHQLVAEQASRAPDRIALRCGGDAVSYRELCGRASALAARLRGAGVGPDTPVGVYLERGVDAVVAMLAVLESGGAFVPLDPAHPRPRTDLIRGDGRIGLVIDAAFLAETPSAEGRRSGPAAAPGNLAYVMYTSGSTGRPKGVDVPQAAVVGLLRTINESLRIGEDDVWLAVTTFGFDISVLEVFLPLINGATLVLATREESVDSARLIAALDRHHVTAMQATPATWWMLIESGWTGRPDLTALCGGEALPTRLAEALTARCGRLWNVYGPTETTIWSAIDEVTDPSRITIGGPIANSAIHVLDDDLEPAPIGMTGEIWIAGGGLARGYRGRPDLTADRFLPCPFGDSGARMYRTGDLGVRLEDGRVRCLGRVDQQVKFRGFRIEPAEIEAALLGDPDVAAAVVVLRGAGIAEPQLVAYVRPASMPGPPADRLRARLREALPHYMVPTAIVTLASIPLTPGGKVDRAALPWPSHAAATGDGPAPATATERTLAAIWNEVLPAGAIGVRDNFFDRGGHSLLMVRVRSQIAERLGMDVAVLDLFRYPTIQALARHLDGGAGPDALDGVDERVARQRAARGRLRGAASGERAGV